MSWDPLLFLKQTNISSPKVVTKSVTGLYYSWNCSNLFWSDLVQTTSLKFCKIKRSNMSCWEAHVGFFRLFMKGIFGPYVLWHFDKKLIFWLVTRIRIRDYTIHAFKTSRWLRVIFGTSNILVKVHTVNSVWFKKL